MKNRKRLTRRAQARKMANRARTWHSTSRVRPGRMPGAVQRIRKTIDRTTKAFEMFTRTAVCAGDALSKFGRISYDGKNGFGTPVRLPLRETTVMKTPAVGYSTSFPKTISVPEFDIEPANESFGGFERKIEQALADSIALTPKPKEQTE